MDNDTTQHDYNDDNKDDNDDKDNDDDKDDNNDKDNENNDKWQWGRSAGARDTLSPCYWYVFFFVPRDILTIYKLIYELQQKPMWIMMTTTSMTTTVWLC